MKYYSELLREVQDFVDTNLAKKFVIKNGVFEGETVTVAGYTKQDGLGTPFHHSRIARYSSNE